MAVTLEEQTDEQLLTQYLAARDQAAFGVIVQRYGPLVWGVCRRVLGNTHDAEDAFQASFIVLLKKMRTIRRKQSIAGWLHKVSHHVALRARKRTSERERPTNVSELGLLMTSAAPASLPDEEMLRVLNEEIALLPEGLRDSVVLCYLQGLSNGQAAQRLGCPEGTIVSRLARARERLQRRLRSRGLVLSGAMALVSLLDRTATAAPPAPLIDIVLSCGQSPAVAALAATTISAGAQRLAEETLKDLLRRRLLPWCLGAVAVTTIAAGAWALITPPRTPAAVTHGAVDQTALELLDGNWQAIHLEFAAGDAAAERQEFTDRCRWVFDGNEVRLQWLWETRAVARVTPYSGPPPQTAGFSIVKGPDSISGKTLRAAFEVRTDRLNVRMLPETEDSSTSGADRRLPYDPLAAQIGLRGLATFRRQSALEAARFEIVASALHIMQGTWSLESRTREGRTEDLDSPDRQFAEIDIDWIEIHQGDDARLIKGKLVLDRTEPDRALDIIHTTDTETVRRRCLYEINDDTFRLCVSQEGGDRPHDLPSRAGDRTTLFVFKHRETPAARRNR